MRKQPNGPSQPQETNAQKAPGQGQLTFYDVMRMQNCKTYKFRKNEMYPSIRPPISRCCNDQAAYFSEAMKATGCGILDPQILNRKFDQDKADNQNEVKKNVTKRNDRIPCINRVQRRGGPLPPEALEYANLSPYEVMRLQNCKAFRVLPCETYPNIRPPVSRCSKEQTAEWVANAVEDIGCDRYFDMEKDDVVDVWKQSPNKHTLSYYGVSTEIAQPEAILFNQAISKSLNKATEFKRKPPQVVPPKPPPKLYMTWPCGDFVLNRPLLKAKVTRMPTVQRKINASEALNWVHCPHPIATEHPFLESARKVKLQAALDMEKKAPKPKHGLRRKYMYCGQCGIPENKCTIYEWFKYRGDPKPTDKAFKEELAKLEKAKAPEPKNYDELYSELVGCFEKVSEKDPLCAQYEKCCKKPSKHGLGDDDGTGDGIGGGGHPGHPGGHHRPTGSQANGSDEDEGGLKPGKKFKKKGDGDSDENGADKDNPNGNKLEKDKGKGGDGDKDGNKEKGDKDKGKGKGKPGKDKKDKDNADNDSSDLDDGTGKPGKGKKEKPDKENTDKPNKKPGMEGYTSDDDKPPKKGQDKGKEKPKEQPKTDETVKQPEELPSFAGTPQNETQEQPPPVAPVDSTIDLPDDTTEKPKDKKKPPKGKHHRPKKPKGNKDDSGKEPCDECPCEICEFMKRRRLEEDTPLIRQMKQDEKRRQLRDYYRIMQAREYEKCRDAVYRAPQHKCDPISCNDCFCSNPKLGEYCDCLDAMQQLQKLLGPKHCIVNNELIFNVEDLRRRICKRFCDCIQCPRHE